MLINGGAAVSVLAFIGLAAQSRIKLDQLNMVANSLGWFAGGAAAAPPWIAYLTVHNVRKLERSF